MSGISSVSGYNSDSYYLWLQLLGSQSTAATNNQDDLLSTSGIDSSSLNTDQFNSLEEEIKKTIEDVLQNYLNQQHSNTSNTSDSTGSSSSGSTDLLTLIQNAIDKVLEDNGIDTDQLKDRMAGMQGMPPPPPLPPGINGMMPPGSDSASSESSSCTDASNGTNDSTSTDELIDQIVKLMQDLLSKLQDYQNGDDSVSGLLIDQQS